MWDICPTFFLFMEIDERKKELRKQIRSFKKEMSVENKKSQSENILSQVENLRCFQQAKIIMCYWSMNDEVQTPEFINKWYEAKDIILPVVDGENLLWKKFTGFKNLTEGDMFGIPEPNGTNFHNLDDVDLIIVPGVAFDKMGNRMGRGKAYYDKTLKHLKAKKIGICFDFQLLDEVPVDEHDIKMDMIISYKL